MILIGFVIGAIISCGVFYWLLIRFRIRMQCIYSSSKNANEGLNAMGYAIYNLCQIREKFRF